MWVVKIGGSLAAAPVLRDWLTVVAEAGAGRVLVVPGGGPFADAVRRLQGRWAFGAVTAHRLALQAMDQYGRVLAGIEPRLTPVNGWAEARAVLAGNGTPILLGSELAARSHLEASWDVTSDSVAAWAAGRLAAQHLVLVKSVTPPAQAVVAPDLAAAAVVDAAFPRQLAASAARGWWLGPGDASVLSGFLQGIHVPAAEILPGTAPARCAAT